MITKLPVVPKLTLARTMRAVYFECGCFSEYSDPSPYRMEDPETGEMKVVKAWNPQPCYAHKSPEGRAALLEACQREFNVG